LIQQLDVTELRAVMACLPEVFENDPNGEKSTWRSNTLEAIRATLTQAEAGTLPKNKLRNKLYSGPPNSKGGSPPPLDGPFDPDAPLHTVIILLKICAENC
jgi:hypothetical protein